MGNFFDTLLVPWLARKREMYRHVVTMTLGFSSDEVALTA